MKDFALSALEELKRVIDLPNGPARRDAMQAALDDAGELGRLTRDYLLTITDLTEDSSIMTIDNTEQTATEKIREVYHDEYPLLREYDAVIAQYNSGSGSINEPAEVGVTNRQAAKLALQRAGRPIRDEHDVAHAEAYIEKLRVEMKSQCPPVERGITDFVIDGMFPFAGAMPYAEDWLAQPEIEKASDIDEVVDLIDTDELRRLLAETLKFAMPSILRKITADDQGRRRREAVEEFGVEPDDSFLEMTAEEADTVGTYVRHTGGIEDCFDGLSPATPRRGECPTTNELRQLRDNLSTWFEHLDTLDAVRKEGESRSTVAFRRFLSQQFDTFFRCRLWLLLEIAHQHAVCVAPYHGSNGELETSNHSVGFYGFHGLDLSE